MLCLKEERARDSAFSSHPGKTRLLPRYRCVHQCNSRSESKRWIHVFDGAREGLLRLMVEFEELLSV